MLLHYRPLLLGPFPLRSLEVGGGVHCFSASWEWYNFFTVIYIYVTARFLFDTRTVATIHRLIYGVHQGTSIPHFFGKLPSFKEGRVMHH